MSEMSTGKRIARNTLMLYFRQILIMLVSLYTVRVVLDVLGAEDYGIYNVVAGLVVLFSFLQNAMTSATQRYLNYEMGKKDEKRLKAVFNTSVFLHIIVVLLLLILSETVGLWFVYHKLKIPAERLTAAVWCYQFSVITTIFNILRVPFHATIIAYEKMSFYALVSIVEVFLKLLTVFTIGYLDYDSLISYSFLLVVISIIMLLIYYLYCNNKYNISKFEKINKDKKLLKELSVFSGWTVLTGIANVTKSQGTNIILNLYHGVFINAALGIANQVNSAIYLFVSNFQTAYTPQLIKSYSSGSYQYFRKLIIQSSKFSFMLLTFILIPFSINADFVVSTWLNQLPSYTIIFIRLILLDSLIGTFIGPLASAMQGIGNIKKYQIIVSFFIFMNLPISLFLLHFGIDPVSIFIVRIVLSIGSLIWRVTYLKDKIGINPLFFIWDPFLKCIIIFVISLSTTYFVYNIFNYSQIITLFITCLFSVLLNCLLFFVFLLNNAEKKQIYSFVESRLKK